MPPPRETITIGLLDYAGAQKSALYGLADFFDTATHFVADEPLPQLVPVMMRFDGETTAPLPPPATLDVLICPPRLRDDVPPLSPDEIAWLRAHHAAGCLMSSVCAGAFILAAAGLLLGRTVTTHWRLQEAFQTRFPDVRLDIEKLLIDDGDIITAGGVMAWTDLGLHLIERFHTPTLMHEVARNFLVEPGQREQRYYSVFTPRFNHGNAAVLKVQHHLQHAYATPQTLAQMADIAGLSSRSFQRQFKQSLGMTPIAYLQLLRLEKARQMLELTTESFARIAWQVGYQNVAGFSGIFKRTVGLGPQEYRRRFGMANR